MQVRASGSGYLVGRGSSVGRPMERRLKWQSQREVDGRLRVACVYQPDAQRKVYGVSVMGCGLFAQSTVEMLAGAHGERAGDLAQGTAGRDESSSMEVGRVGTRSAPLLTWVPQPDLRSRSSPSRTAFSRCNSREAWSLLELEAQSSSPVHTFRSHSLKDRDCYMQRVSTRVRAPTSSKAGLVRLLFSSRALHPVATHRNRTSHWPSSAVRARPSTFMCHTPVIASVTCSRLKRARPETARQTRAASLFVSPARIVARTSTTVTAIPAGRSGVVRAKAVICANGVYKREVA
ncbi:hypothetical protein FA95DRAFT_1048230 [Auriscalpium vulgare]|uniref:Uncharacterized protein n=1 Tax=Auriscalpium vulgare TaxID=40419 RepID=A0ACB8S996_9AGAM|nr:hypothetical protein FA95DRAFT_1048230 [Auriscalpium vulgare]